MLKHKEWGDSENIPEREQVHEREWNKVVAIWYTLSYNNPMETVLI